MPVQGLLIALEQMLTEWMSLRWAELRFSNVTTTTYVAAVMLGLALAMLLVRGARPSAARSAFVAIPALLPAVRRNHFSFIRHAPLALFLVGFPFFALALADPRTSFTREEGNYRGRRIALLVDGSSSMTLNFAAGGLKAQENRAFYTAVASAEHFVRLRMKDANRDLVALVEFGNEAHVVTPFTTDYDNILLSINLIGDPAEWGRFSDWGTTVLQGLQVSAQLFKTFDFLDASGNLIIVFTDGRDDQTTLMGKELESVVTVAKQQRIPIYMIRVGFNLDYGAIPQDRLWSAAVERTGGRFFAANNEAAIRRALAEIDRVAVGTIQLRHYTMERPRFAGFALIAIALWLAAGAMKLTLPWFRTFP